MKTAFEILRIPNEVAYAERRKRFSDIPKNEFLGLARAFVLKNLITYAAQITLRQRKIKRRGANGVGQKEQRKNRYRKYFFHEN